jgi:hypothetical protein
MGRRIAVSSIIRHVPPIRTSGLLRVVDLDTGAILLTAAVPDSVRRPMDPNPRGGLRGGRGVSFANDRFVLANADRLFVFDAAWRMVGQLTNPWTADVHDVLAEPDGVWVTCTACDLLLRLDWEGRVLDQWLWRADRGLVAQFGFRRLPTLDPRIDYRDPRHRANETYDIGHVNAVARGPGGVIVSLGRVLTPRAYRSRRVRRRLLQVAEATPVASRAAAAARRRQLRSAAADPLPMPDLAPGSSALVLVRSHGRLADRSDVETLVRSDELRFPNHNAAQVGDLLVFNDSNHGRLVGYRLGAGGESSVQVPGDPPYARGLAWLAGDVFAVGSQRPTAVHTIDLGQQRLVSSIVLGSDSRESVSSIAVVPDSFDEPPPRLRFAG